MSDRTYNVLFLCTGNSARSIMAECAVNRWGGSRFKGHSAGSRPKGDVHPMTLRLLRQLNYATGELRSKGWEEFARPAARRSTSSSRSATRPRGRSVPSGPVSP